MCCFSIGAPVGIIARLFARPVHVSSTHIFARMIAPGVQALAYGLNLSTTREVAMILPVPVVPGSGDDALRFVSLEREPRMFEELDALFAEVREPLRRGGLPAFRAAAPTLVVHQIGSFIASYVPRRADFTRLDARFRLPDVLFDAVPAYADYGFAVFQLAPGKVTVHPMAMTFPTRAPDRLFFPTVHVHDGKFRAAARFDHALYYQRPGPAEPGDETAVEPPRKAYAELVAPAQPIARRTLRAKLPNADTWIAAAAEALDPGARGGYTPGS